MAMTINEDLIIYNREIQTSFLERQQDVLNVFNDSSNGAIVLRNEMIEGDFDKSAYYKDFGEVSDRDVNSTSSVDLDSIDQGERIGVKYAWKFNPVAITEESFKRRARSLSEFAQLTGAELADKVLMHNISVAMGSFDAAVDNNSAMKISGSFGGDGYKLMTKALRAFGDRSSRLALFAMDSATFYDMVDMSISERVFNEDFAVIHGGQPATFGRPILVSDQFESSTIYGLQTGAIQLTESQAPGTRLWDINDAENLALGFRAEGTVNIDLMGYSYDGSSNPKLDDLKESDNWEKFVESDKNTAGVVVDVEESDDDDDE